MYIIIICNNSQPSIQFVSILYKSINNRIRNIADSINKIIETRDIFMCNSRRFSVQ